MAPSAASLLITISLTAWALPFQNHISSLYELNSLYRSVQECPLVILILGRKYTRKQVIVESVRQNKSNLSISLCIFYLAFGFSRMKVESSKEDDNRADKLALGTCSPELGHCLPPPPTNYITSF